MRHGRLVGLMSGSRLKQPNGLDLSSSLEEWEACLWASLPAEFGSFNLLSAAGDPLCSL